jgi:aminoglycoside phosphotransferase (APT) family kinase protein
MSAPIDEPRPVRDGEQLDLARLRDYLSAHLPEAASGPLEVEQFPHGHSNLTYLLRKGDREWILRRPPFGNRVKTAHDMGREFRILSRLCHVYQPAPAPCLYCEDEAILGAPFYLMERRKGVILRGSPPPGRSIPPELVRRLCETLVDNMALLHALDYRAAGLDDLGKPLGYIHRQVTGWTKRYNDARTDDCPDIDRTITWLAENRPAESVAVVRDDFKFDNSPPDDNIVLDPEDLIKFVSVGATLIHNDFKFDNLVLNPGDLTRIVAVLDWEMATIGDPLMDLGTTLAYWTEAGDPAPLHQFIVGPTTQPGALSRRELVERYGQTTGRDTSNMLFCYICGLFKVAVIAQQIYARYVRGLTRDPRFAGFNQVVAALGLGAVRAIDTGRI